MKWHGLEGRQAAWEELLSFGDHVLEERFSKVRCNVCNACNACNVCNVNKEIGAPIDALARAYLTHSRTAAHTLSSRAPSHAPALAFTITPTHSPSLPHTPYSLLKPTP